MAFFSFFDDEEEKRRKRLLTSPEQMPPLSLSQPGSILDSTSDYKKEEARRRSIKPSGDIDTDPQFETRMNLGETRGQIAPDRSVFLQKKNASDETLRSKAINLLRSLASPKDTRMRPTEDLSKYINELHSPGAGARAAEIVNKAIGALPNAYAKDTPAFKELVDLNREYNQLLTQDTGAVLPQSPYTEENLRAAESKVQELRQQIVTEPLDEQRKVLESQLKIYSDQAKELKGKLETEGKARLEAVPTPEEAARVEDKAKKADENAKRAAAVSGEDGTPGKDSIFEVFDAFSGNGRREVANQAMKVLDSIGQKVPFKDPMQRIAFWAAMPSYAEALGPQAFSRVVGPLANNERQLDKIRKGYAQKQKEGEDIQAGANDALREKYERQQQIMTELANDDIMNTPLGISLFIIMSLVLGPNMSAFILTRSKTRGKLQAEYKQIGEDVKELRQRVASGFQMGQRASFEALDAESRFGLQAQEAAQRRSSMRESTTLDAYYKWKQMEREFQLRKQLNGGKEDPVQKELLGSFRMRQAIAGRAEFEVRQLNEKVEKLTAKLADIALSPKDKNTIRLDIKRLNEKLKAAETNLENANLAMATIEDTWTKRYGATAGVGATEEAGGE